MNIKRTLEKMDEQIEKTLHLIGWIKEDIEQNPNKKILYRELRAMETILNLQQRRRAAMAAQLFT
jgi:hypothetical protein